MLAEPSLTRPPCLCQGHGGGRVSGWPGRSPLVRALAVRHPDVATSPQALSWVDHHWHEDGLYVSEPYGLSAADFADLAWLAEQGWRVAVTARNARHYPGATVAVHIRRAP